MGGSFSERFARQVVVKSMRISEGESVFIYTIREALDLADEMALECDFVGAKPLVVTFSDEYMKASLTKPSERFVESTPKHWLRAMEATDAYIAMADLHWLRFPWPESERGGEDESQSMT